MEAAVLYGKEKIKIEKLDVGRLKYGQVYVKVFFSGICGSQFFEFFGLRGNDPWLPHLFGHEAIGEVVNIGPGVKKVKKKDRVIISWVKSKGVECGTINFKKDNITINAGKVTTFSNYTVVSENRVVKVSKKIPLKFGALLGCAFLTGAGLVINKFSKVNKNKLIAVYGLGGIGLSAVSMLTALGFKNIIAIDKNIKKLKIAKELGSHLLINVNKNNPLNIIKKKYNKLVDYCIEAGGSVTTIENAFNIINNQGSLYFSSHPEIKKKIRIDPHQLISGKKIIGCWGGFSKPDKDISLIYKKMPKKHILIFESNIKIFKLKKIIKAFREMKNSNWTRAMIKFEH